jgi:regulatory protein
VPTVTALEPQVHDPERVNVYLDGAFAFGASLLVVVARGIVVGREISDDDITALQHDDSVEQAYGAALGFLSYRPRSRRELDDYLRRRKVEAHVASAVAQRLERLGLIDDREFARFWVDNRRQFRPRGARALQQEMRLKGVPNEIIADALGDLGEEDRLAYEAGAKRVRSLHTADRGEFFRRMVGFLQRRGFTYEVAAGTARRLWTESHEGESLDEE